MVFSEFITSSSGTQICHHWRRWASTRDAEIAGTDGMSLHLWRFKNRS